MSPTVCPFVDTEVHEDVTVVHFTGQRVFLDDEGIASVAEELFSLVENLRQGQLLLDFGNVDYISSPAVGMLIRLHKKAEAAGGSFTLCGVTPQVYEVFKRIHLNRLLDIRVTE